MNYQARFVLLLIPFLLASTVALNLPFRKNQRKSNPKTTTTKAPTLVKCPRLPELQYSRLVGAFPSFRKDAVTSLLQHAEYCWQNDLPGTRISVGIVGTFDLVVDPQLVEFITSDKPIPSNPEGVFFKSALDRRGVGLLAGEGVLLSDGADHTRKRRLVLPSFDAKTLPKFVKTMESVSLEFSKNLREEGHHMANVPQWTSTVAMKIVGLCLFSTNVVASEIYQDISSCIKHVAYVTRHPFAAPQWVPTKRNRQYKKSLKKLDDIIFSMMDSGKKRLKDNKSNTNPTTKGQDLLGMLLAARYDDAENAKLTDQELRDELMTIFLAGHETTANTISWTLWYLSDPANLHWQDKIVAEYHKVQTELGGFTPQILEDPDVLKYTRVVLCEALRLRTPSYAVDREVQQDVVAPGPILLKRNSILLLAPMVMHMNPKHFEEPHKFDPTRFLDIQSNDPWDGPFDRSVYLPFGAGRKRCIGYKFAQWEMLIIVSTLLTNVRITRSPEYDPTKELSWDAGVTWRPDPALELHFEPRVVAAPIAE